MREDAKHATLIFSEMGGGCFFLMS